MTYTYTEQINGIQEAIKTIEVLVEYGLLGTDNATRLKATLNDAGSSIAALNITKDLTCKAAEDLEKVNPSEPDFEIRNLSEYSAEDLERLYKSVTLSYRQAKENNDQKEASAFDVWCYRIRDAIKLKE